MKGHPLSTKLPTLTTTTPAEGYDLAVELSRMSIKLTQPDAELRDRMRPDHAQDAEALILVTQVVATHFAAVASVNNFWKDVG
tara:strand:- start:2158 stop:2406 length:249 start_codon:yes stop_codon:yes gene_type:complete